MPTAFMSGVATRVEWNGLRGGRKCCLACGRKGFRLNGIVRVVPGVLRGCQLSGRALGIIQGEFVTDSNGYLCPCSDSSCLVSPSRCALFSPEHSGSV